MHHQNRAHPRAFLLTVVAAIGLIAAACSGGTSAIYGPPGASSGAADQAGSATIAIASPANGATLSIPFDVQLDSSVALADPETGEHHAHLYFDTDTGAADYDIVYGDSWQVTRPLTPGSHTITVALANPDHSLAGPTQTISVMVAAPDA